MSTSGYILCTKAVENGDLETLEREYNKNMLEWNEFTCASAAIHGHLDILIWLREHGCPWDYTTFSFAAMGGHLDVLIYAYENNCPQYDNNSPRYDDVCLNAAENGHLHVLKWVKEQEPALILDKYTAVLAAKGGHIKVLKWLRENGCPWDDKICVNAAFHDNLELLMWARKNGCSGTKKTDIRA